MISLNVCTGDGKRKLIFYIDFRTTGMVMDTKIALHICW